MFSEHFSGDDKNVLFRLINDFFFFAQKCSTIVSSFSLLPFYKKNHQIKK